MDPDVAGSCDPLEYGYLHRGEFKKVNSELTLAVRAMTLRDSHEKLRQPLKCTENRTRLIRWTSMYYAHFGTAG
jgi:hypothetical protein